MRSNLHYETSGDAGAPAILFLHGFMGTSLDWGQIVDPMSRDFYCVTVDLPGHGQSVNLADPGAYAIEGACCLLERVLSEIDVDSAHVVGYSMGGRLALYFARHFAERCRNVVLESASPGLKTASQRAQRIESDEARARRLETEDYGRFLEEWYRQPLFSTLARHGDLLDQMIASRMINSPDELARTLRKMGTGAQPSLWNELERVEAAALAVAGALDGKFVEIAEQMALLKPTMRTAIISNAGHNVHAERPTVFRDLLRDFLKKPSK